jgi:hypothetical protein
MMVRLSLDRLDGRDLPDAAPVVPPPYDPDESPVATAPEDPSTPVDGADTSVPSSDEATQIDVITYSEEGFSADVTFIGYSADVGEDGGDVQFTYWNVQPSSPSGLGQPLLLIHRDDGSAAGSGVTTLEYRDDGSMTPVVVPAGFGDFMERVGRGAVGAITGGLAGAGTGAAGGAVVGSIVPGAGTLAGAGTGAVGGAVAGAVSGFIRGVFADDVQEAATAGAVDGAIAGPLGGAGRTALVAKRALDAKNAAAAAAAAQAAEIANARRIIEKGGEIIKRTGGKTPAAEQAMQEIRAAFETLARYGLDK